MADRISLAYAMRLSPADAIAYFQSKGYAINWNWWKAAEDAHARAFTVAKATRMDILADIREAIQQTLEEGTTEREFIQALEPKLKAKGWWGKQVIVDSAGGAEVVQLGSPHRLRTIYRTNKFSAYQAGRYKQQKEQSEARPYWQYLAIMDSRTRPSHAALHEKVFPHDDPIWEHIYPPNGYNCRCRVRTLSEYRLKQEGLSVDSSSGKLSQEMVEAGVDKRTGEVIHKPVTVWRGTDAYGQDAVFRTDAGFDLNQGQLAYGLDVEIMRKISRVEDRAIRAQAVQAINNSSLRHAQFAAWVDQVLPNRGAGHTAQTIHLMDERATAAFRARGQEPARVLVINEKRLAHADSPKHREAGIALNIEEFKALPKRLASGEARLYWDKHHQNLVYALDAGENQSILIATTTNRKLKKLEGRLDQLVNAFKVPTSRLQRRGRFEPIDN